MLQDPGCGKTSCTLAAIKVLREQKLARRTLVIAPLRVCYSVWPAEVRKWSDFNDMTIGILHGPKKGDVLHDGADICAINPEGLEWLLRDPKKFRGAGFDVLVVDELSKFKHTNTKRFKLLKPFLPEFSRRWGLTGSPAANGLMDLFGQMYILDQGRSLGRFITHYRNEFFVPDYMGYNWTLKPGADQRIYERIAPLVMRVSASDHLDLPELVENNIYVDLPDPVMKQYRLMESVLVAKIKDNTVTAANAAAASTKCRQIANGGVYYEEFDGLGMGSVCNTRGSMNLHYEKANAVRDLVEELQGEPVLVAYDFEHDLERLKEVLGKDTPHIGGGVSAKKGEDICCAWNRGEIPVLLAHPATLAHGVNLQEVGHHVCWHSPTWNYEHRDQFIRRVLRQGNKSKRVIVHNIIARNTIDEIILGVVKSKEREQGALFSALKELAARS